MSKLYFCTDGYLRVRTNDEKHMVSVKFMQEQLENNDLVFWTKWWNQPIIFEKNLTFSQFFQCMEPWLDFWTLITQKDLKAYYQEMKKPVLVNQHKDDLSWLSIDYRTDLRPEVLFPVIENKEELDNGKDIIISKQWQYYSYYELIGYCHGEEKEILVDWLPMNVLANLPIVLNPKQILMIDEYLIKTYSENTPQLVNQKSLGVENIFISEDNEAQFSYIIGDKVHTLREVIEGIFYGFDASPEERDLLDVEFQEQSMEEVSEEDIEEHYDTTEYFVELDSIYASQRASMFQHVDEKDPYFDKLLVAAKKDGQSKIRIGRLNEAQPLENRILHWIKK